MRFAFLFVLLMLFTVAGVANGQCRGLLASIRANHHDRMAALHQRRSATHAHHAARFDARRPAMQSAAPEKIAAPKKK